MMEQQTRRVLAVSGPVFGAGLILGALVLGGDGPKDTATGEQVVAYYKAHQGVGIAGVFVVAIAAIALLFFSAALREGLRDVQGASTTMPRAAAAAGVVAATGFLFMSAVRFTLLQAGGLGLPDAARTLNLLDHYDFFPVVGGLAALYLAAGLAARRANALPTWLTWSSIVLGVVAVLGPLGQLAFILSPLWVAVTGVLLSRRSASDRDVFVASAERA